MRHAALVVVLLLLAPLGCKGNTENIARTHKTDDTTAKKDTNNNKPDGTTSKKHTSRNKPGDGTATSIEAEDRAVALVKKLGGVVQRDETKAGRHQAGTLFL